MAQNENVDQTSAEAVDPGKTFDWMSLAAPAQATGVDLSLQQFLTNVAPADQTAAVAAITKGVAAPDSQTKQAAVSDLQQLVDPGVMRDYLDKFVPTPSGKVSDLQFDVSKAYGPNGERALTDAMNAAVAGQGVNIDSLTGSIDAANRATDVKTIAQDSKIKADQAALKGTQALEATQEAQALAKAQADNAKALGEMEANWGFFDIFSSERRGKLQQLYAQEDALKTQFAATVQRAVLANQEAQILIAESNETANYAKAVNHEENYQAKLKHTAMLVGLSNENMSRVISYMDKIRGDYVQNEERNYQRGQVRKAGKDKELQEEAQIDILALVQEYQREGKPLPQNFASLDFKGASKNLSKEDRANLTAVVRSGAFNVALGQSVDPNRPNSFIPMGMEPAFEAAQKAVMADPKNDWKNMDSAQRNSAIQNYLKTSNQHDANSPLAVVSNTLATNLASLQDLQRQAGKLQQEGKTIPKGMQDAFTSTQNFQNVVNEAIQKKLLKADENIFTPSNLKMLHTLMTEKAGGDAKSAGYQMQIAFYRLANVTRQLQGINDRAVTYAGGNPMAPTIMVKRGDKSFNAASDDLFYLVGTKPKFETGMSSTLESRATEMQMTSKTPYDF